MKTYLRELKSALYATRVYLTGLFTDQHVDWYTVYDRRMAFYEIFENWD